MTVLVPFLTLGSAYAAPAAGRHIYASQSPGKTHDGTSCATGFTTIKQAISVARSGDTVVVCPAAKPYPEGDLVIDQGIRLVGEHRPVIDASRHFDGIDVFAPNVVILGLVVENAANAGIAVSTHHVIIVRNVLTGNNVGISLNGASNVEVFRNIASDNGEYGIVLQDVARFGFGPVVKSQCFHNLVSENFADKNGEAGIKLSAASPGGSVFDNQVTGNTANGNGRSKRVEIDHAAGILLTNDDDGVIKDAFTSPSGSGSVFGNTVNSNLIAFNGGPGISVLAEGRMFTARSGSASGGNLSDNVLQGNLIGTNNLLPPARSEPADLQSRGATRTLGILVESSTPQLIHVVNNVITKDFYGIVASSTFKEPVGFLQNVFVRVLVPIKIGPFRP